MGRSNYTVLLEVVQPSDIKDMQKKLNTWKTTGVLIKYNITPIGDSVLFNILRKKGL